MKEYYFLKFVQVVILINTFALGFGFIQAIKGRVSLHKKIQGIALIVTFVGVVGLVITVLMGWDYAHITTPARMAVHRCFSTPLFILLIAAAITGIKGKRSVHLPVIYAVIPFWFGALITGWWFFF